MDKQGHIYLTVKILVMHASGDLNIHGMAMKALP
jgi:hypothetical protein